MTVIEVKHLRGDEFSARRSDGILPSEKDWREIEAALRKLQSLRQEKKLPEVLQ